MTLHAPLHARILRHLLVRTLRRRAARLEAQIRKVSADALQRIGQQSLYLGELMPALSLELAEVRRQIRELTQGPLVWPTPLLAQIGGFS